MRVSTGRQLDPDVEQQTQRPTAHGQFISLDNVEASHEQAGEVRTALHVRGHYSGALAEYAAKQHNFNNNLKAPKHFSGTKLVGGGSHASATKTPTRSKTLPIIWGGLPFLPYRAIGHTTAIASAALALPRILVARHSCALALLRAHGLACWTIPHRRGFAPRNGQTGKNAI